MGKYTIEEIYVLVGKDDKTASVQLIPGTASYEKYGSYVTVTFLYKQMEREVMDEMIRQPFTHSGKVKAQYLVGELSADLIRELKETGLDSEDIWNIGYLMAAEKNTFHSQEKRSIKKIELQLQVQPKGRDYDWMYGFAKKMVRKDIGITPQQRNFYLAGKLYYEEDELTDDERSAIFPNEGQMNSQVEWEYLQIKLMRDEIDEEGLEREDTDQ